MHRKTFRYFSLLVALFLVVSVFTGCAGKGDGGNSPDNTASGSQSGTNSGGEISVGSAGGAITIGVMVPTSGSEAYYGNDMYQSYLLAVDEINASGGVLGRDLELYLADDGCDANMASQAASKIISKGVDFVVGGYCSGATIPALQQYFDANLIMLISAANSTDITKLGLNQSFMINSPGTHAALTLTDLCKSLGTKKVALIHQGDSYTKNLSDICEEALPKSGIDIATIQVMEKGAADVSAIVTAIRNSGADFVYWCGYHADGSNVIKQLRQGGYTGDIAVGDGSASVELITACGPAGEGVYVTSPPFVEFAAGGEKFVSDYLAKFKVEPGTYATLCYDTIYMLKQAIEKAGSIDTAAVRDIVQGISYQGLSGMIKFTPERELAVSNFIILQISNGAFKLITL
ncbi:MAG: branched-chain amino acid ABC transporter substrate-binding protein [Oscillospiraceae bacterium]|jgi:branched-chain amino acid transport system substrate-binding protein|nr:branched-chain amino acid ABC transporter substrate-binding protein [Oscillospiraceae bacterium]